MKNPHKIFLTLGIIVSALILFSVITNNKNETGIFNIAYAIISFALIVLNKTKFNECDEKMQN